MKPKYKCPGCGADITEFVEQLVHEQWAKLGGKQTAKKTAAQRKNMAKLNAAYTPEKRSAAYQKRLETIRRRKAEQGEPVGALHRYKASLDGGKTFIDIGKLDDDAINRLWNGIDRHEGDDIGYWCEDYASLIPGSETQARRNYLYKLSESIDLILGE